MIDLKVPFTKYDEGRRLVVNTRSDKSAKPLLPGGSFSLIPSPPSREA